MRHRCRRALPGTLLTLVVLLSGFTCLGPRMDAERVLDARIAAGLEATERAWNEELAPSVARRALSAEGALKQLNALETQRLPTGVDRERVHAVRLMLAPLVDDDLLLLQDVRWFESALLWARVAGPASSTAITPAVPVTVRKSPSLEIPSLIDPEIVQARRWVGWLGARDAASQKAARLTARYGLDVGADLRRVLLGMFQRVGQRLLMDPTRAQRDTASDDARAITMEVGVSRWSLQRGPFGDRQHVRPRIVLVGDARLLERGTAQPLWAARCESSSDQPVDPIDWTPSTADDTVFAAIVGVAVRRCAFQILAERLSAHAK